MAAYYSNPQNRFEDVLVASFRRNLYIEIKPIFPALVTQPFKWIILLLEIDGELCLKSWTTPVPLFSLFNYSTDVGFGKLYITKNNYSLSPSYLQWAQSN